MQAPLSQAENHRPTPPTVPPVDLAACRPYVRLAAMLSRYHRVDRRGLQPPAGPCIYVTRHGFGYLSLDIAAALYALAFADWHEHGGPYRPVRPTVAVSQLERHLPVLGRIKDCIGAIAPDEPTIVAALRAGNQVLMTPGGRREAQPGGQQPYALRWSGRFGFLRTALRTGAPIVPLATVGGHRAFPGVSFGRLSFWTPWPLPVRLRIGLGTPISVPCDPAAADDRPYMEDLWQKVWISTTALYNRLGATSEAP